MLADPGTQTAIEKSCQTLVIVDILCSCWLTVDPASLCEGTNQCKHPILSCVLVFAFSGQILKAHGLLPNVFVTFVLRNVDGRVQKLLFLLGWCRSSIGG